MLAAGLALAVVIGAALGLLGGGGSILTVPLLHYVFGLETHAAIAGSLAVVAVTALVALVPYARRGQVQWRTGGLFGAASMVGSFGAARVARHVPPAVLLVAFALVMLGAAVSMVRGGVRAPSTRTLAPALAIALGVLVGGVAGFVGAGGGFLIVPTLTAFAQLAIHDAIGTSLLVITLNSAAGFAGAHGTSLDLERLAMIAGAMITGSIAGSLLAHRVPPARLRLAFGWLLVGMGLVVLGSELPGLLGA